MKISATSFRRGNTFMIAVKWCLRVASDWPDNLPMTGVQKTLTKLKKGLARLAHVIILRPHNLGPVSTGWYKRPASAGLPIGSSPGQAAQPTRVTCLSVSQLSERVIIQDRYAHHQSTCATWPPDKGVQIQVPSPCHLPSTARCLPSGHEPHAEEAELRAS